MNRYKWLIYCTGIIIPFELTIICDIIFLKITDNNIIKSYLLALLCAVIFFKIGIPFLVKIISDLSEYFEEDDP